MTDIKVQKVQPVKEMDYQTLLAQYQRLAKEFQELRAQTALQQQSVELQEENNYILNRIAQVMEFWMSMHIHQENENDDGEE